MCGVSTSTRIFLKSTVHIEKAAHNLAIAPSLRHHIWCAAFSSSFTHRWATWYSDLRPKPTFARTMFPLRSNMGGWVGIGDKEIIPRGREGGHLGIIVYNGEEGGYLCQLFIFRDTWQDLLGGM